MRTIGTISKRRILKAIIAVVLGVAICAQTVAAAGVKIRERKTEQSVIDENGTEYTVVMSVVDEEHFTLDYINEKTREKTSIVFSDGKTTKTDYMYIGKNLFGTNKYVKVKEEKQNFTEMMKRAKEKNVSAAGYGEYRYMTIAYKSSDGEEHFHYYRVGTSSPDLGYVEIGCVRQYRLANNATYLNEYIKKVDENIRETGLAGCSAGVAALALVILVLSPSKALAATALSALGIDAVGIYHLYKAYAAYKEADTYFDMTKAYGIRVD